MALSQAERKRQQQLRAKAEKEQSRRQANRDSTRNAALEAERKRAARERERLRQAGEVAKIHGGGSAADRRTKNNETYLDRQSSARQQEINKNWNRNDANNGGRVTSASRPTSQFAGARDREFQRVRSMGAGTPSSSTASSTTRPSGGGSSSTRSTRTSGGGGGGSTRTYASTMPAVVTRTVDAPASSRQTGDKQKDMATWAQSNKKLGEALGKRNSERGTSRTTNRLMQDLVGGMKKREDAQDQQNGTGKYFGPASPGKSANNSPSAANKFNTTDSLYTPKSKLDDDKERRRRAMELKNNYGRYTG
jgi:hypothetical protein